MQGIKKVKIEKVDIQEPKDFVAKAGPNKGKPGRLWPVGIKSPDIPQEFGGWANGALFDEGHVNGMRAKEAGDEIELDFYEEEYKGKTYQKWRVISDKARERSEIIARIEDLERRVGKLDGAVDQMPEGGPPPPALPDDDPLADEPDPFSPAGEQAKDEQQTLDDLPF